MYNRELILFGTSLTKIYTVTVAHWTTYITNQSGSKITVDNYGFSTSGGSISPSSINGHIITAFYCSIATSGKSFTNTNAITLDPEYTGAWSITRLDNNVNWNNSSGTGKETSNFFFSSSDVGKQVQFLVELGEVT